MGPISSLITPDLDTHLREQMARWTIPGVVLGVLRRDITTTDAIRQGEQSSPPHLLKPLSQREFVVTPDENEGSRIDVIAGEDGAIRFLRMDGRLYERAPEAARR